MTSYHRLQLYHAAHGLISENSLWTLFEINQQNDIYMTIAESLRNAFVTQGIAEDDIWCANIVHYQDEEKKELVLKLNEDNSFNMSEDEYWDLLSKYQVGDGLGNGLAVGSRVWTDGINGKRLFTFVDVDGCTYWECINPFPPTRLDPNHLWET